MLLQCAPLWTIDERYWLQQTSTARDCSAPQIARVPDGVVSRGSSSVDSSNGGCVNDLGMVIGSPGRAWCSTCQIFRPPGCSHCRVCDACVLGHDHHCWWLATCIGECNHRAFVLTLVYAAAISLIVLEHARTTLADGPCPTSLDHRAVANTSNLEVLRLLAASKPAELAWDTWVCETVGMTDLGAGWMLFGWMAFSIPAVLIYVADIAPTVGCLIVLNAPGLMYFISTYERASLWMGVAPLSASHYAALVCGMFASVMVALWGSFALQSLVLVSDGVLRKNAFRDDRRGWCIERGLYCCCSYSFHGITDHEEMLLRLRRLWRFFTQRSPDPPMPWRHPNAVLDPV